MSDPLAGLLAEYRAPEPSPGLAERVAVAALGHRQEAAMGPRPARNRRWLVRPLLGVTAAAGLAFSSAVAASLAGIELPLPVQQVVDALPLVGKQVREEPAPPAPVLRATPQVARPAPVVETPAPDPTPRVSAMRRRVQERRAAGLPTPGADRLERAIERRRAAGLPVPNDQQMERILERRAAVRRQRRQEGWQQDVAPGRSDSGVQRRSLTPEQRERLRNWRVQRRERLERWREMRREPVQDVPVD